MSTLIAGLFLIFCLCFAGFGIGLMVAIFTVFILIAVLDALISWPLIIMAGLIYYFFFHNKRQRYQY